MTMDGAGETYIMQDCIFYVVVWNIILKGEVQFSKMHTIMSLNALSVIYNS